MRLFFWIAFISFVTFSSCRTVREGEIYQQVQQDNVQVGFIDDSLWTLEVAYIGAIGHSYIFECTVDNKSEDPLVLDKNQFSLELNQGLIIHPIDEEEIVKNLKNIRGKLKKERKTNTIFAGILVGVGVLAGATSGFNAGDVLIYSADPILAILDERSWYQRNINSVEDEMEYIRSAQFNQFYLPPNTIVTRDMLFPTVKVKSDVDLVFTMYDQEFVITFPKKIFR